VPQPLRQGLVYQCLARRLGHRLAKVAYGLLDLFQVATSALKQKQCRHHALQTKQILGAESPLIDQPKAQPGLKCTQFGRVRLDQVKDLRAVLPAPVAIVEDDGQHRRQAAGFGFVGFAAQQMLRKWMGNGENVVCPRLTRAVSIPLKSGHGWHTQSITTVL